VGGEEVVGPNEHVEIDAEALGGTTSGLRPERHPLERQRTNTSASEEGGHLAQRRGSVKPTQRLGSLPVARVAHRRRFHPGNLGGHQDRCHHTVLCGPVEGGPRDRDERALGLETEPHSDEVEKLEGLLGCTCWEHGSRVRHDHGVSDTPRPTRVLGAQVRYEPAPDPPAEPVWTHEGASATADTVWFPSEHFSVCVRGTTEVIIEELPGGDESLIGPMLYGWATRILLLHAGTFSLHGSLVRLGDRHVVIGGNSGAGKSTTIMALALGHGAQIIVDDVVPIRIEDGMPIAHPFPRPVNLMLDTIERLGLEVDGARIGQGPYQKRAVDLGEATGPVPVDLLVTLVAYDPDPHEDWPNTVDPIEEPTDEQPVILNSVAGAERLRRITRLANNQGLAAAGDRGQPFFEWSTALAGSLPTVEVARLRRADTLDEVCRRIVTTAASLDHS
jgi:hypothetical protein